MASQNTVKALDGIKDILVRECKAAFARIRHPYSDAYDNNSKEHIEASRVKQDTILQLSKEICEYAEKKYKPYGITQVDVCKKESIGPDRLIINLTADLGPISREITAYALKKYKDYNLLDIPTCHRTAPVNGKLDIQIKVRAFPGNEDIILADEQNEKDYQEALAQIDAWYFDALKCIARKAELPDTPSFMKHPAASQEDKDPAEED